MFGDQSFMRESQSGRSRQVSVILMVVLVVAFALQCINDVYLRQGGDGMLGLTGNVLARGYVWQLLTFQFLHVDIWHLVVNLMGLWFFGRFVESVLGLKRFLFAYFGSGVVGGLLQSLLMLLFPAHFGVFVFGASAGIMGIYAIFARLQGNSEIRWNFILPIRADVVLWITAGISLFFTLVPSMRGGFAAHAAHLGGILAGIAFVRMGWHQDFNPLPGSRLLEAWKRRAPRRSRPVVKVRFPKAFSSWQEESRVSQREKTDTDFMSEEVDPILEKISAHGMQSLTEKEKAVLEKARARIDKR